MKPENFTCFKYKNHVLYVQYSNDQLGCIHYTTDFHWFEYLKRRKVVPDIVRTYNRPNDLIAAMEKEGILI